MENKKSADERTKEIIERFKKLSLEEMEMVLIRLGIPTDRKIATRKRGWNKSPLFNTKIKKWSD